MINIFFNKIYMFYVEDIEINMNLVFKGCLFVIDYFFFSVNILKFLKQILQFYDYSYI